MDSEDMDAIALQSALDFIEIVLKTDPGVYDELATPVVELLKQRLGGQ